MNKELSITTVCLVVLAICAINCAPPQHARRITSNPSDASIYYGQTKDAISSHQGQTPNYRYSTCWNAGYYKVEKKGYLPKILSIPYSCREVNLHFDLPPLPKVPAPPKVEYPDPESVAMKPLSIDSPDAGFAITKGSKIATMTFKQHEGTGAGSLVADSLILNLQRMGYNVIDRELIESVLKEQNIIAEGKTNLSDLEVSKKIGQLFHADYFISGAITEYSAQSQNISLSPVIPESEKVRYVDEYNSYLNIFQEADMTPPQTLKTIQEWEIEYASRPKSSYINIARVGITLKVVEIKTSKIVWVGIAYTSDLRLQNGMKRIVEGMIKSFTGN